MAKDNCPLEKEEQSFHPLIIKKGGLAFSKGQTLNEKQQRKIGKGRMTKNNCQRKKGKGKSLIDLQKRSKKEEKMKHNIF